ncbi:hypothetical protein WJX73_007725 [Symbiochloris irregularis]|uniref:UvrD-like helicase ATP-binding domain-containing protein n=1 Tax=Symbiochloris irregularis TaxID=706552 RepID=A0AAW1PBY9_9CHLO
MSHLISAGSPLSSVKNSARCSSQAANFRQRHFLRLSQCDSSPGGREKQRLAACWIDESRSGSSGTFDASNMRVLLRGPLPVWSKLQVRPPAPAPEAGPFSAFFPSPEVQKAPRLNVPQLMSDIKSILKYHNGAAQASQILAMSRPFTQDDAKEMIWRAVAIHCNLELLKVVLNEWTELPVAARDTWTQIIQPLSLLGVEGRRDSATKLPHCLVQLETLGINQSDVLDILVFMMDYHADSIVTLVDVSPKDPDLWLNPLALAVHLGCSKEVMYACASKEHPLSWRHRTSGQRSADGGQSALQLLQMRMDQARLSHNHLEHDKYGSAYTVISSYDRQAREKEMPANENKRQREHRVRQEAAQRAAAEKEAKRQRQEHEAIMEAQREQERLKISKGAQSVLDDVQTTVRNCETTSELRAALKRLGSLCKENAHGIFNPGESIAKESMEMLKEAAWEAATGRKDMNIVNTLDKFMRTLPDHLRFTWQRMQVSKQQGNKQLTHVLEKAFTEDILDVFCAILKLDHMLICKLSEAPMARAVWKRYPIEWFQAMLSPCLEHREAGVDEIFAQSNNLRTAISEAMCYERGDVVDLLLPHSNPSTLFRRRVESVDDDSAPGQQQQGSKLPPLHMNALFLALVLENRDWGFAVLKRGRDVAVIRKRAERLRQQEERMRERREAQWEAQQAGGAKGGKKGDAQQQGRGGRRAQAPEEPAEEEISHGTVQLPWLKHTKLGVGQDQTVLLKAMDVAFLDLAREIMVAGASPVEVARDDAGAFTTPLHKAIMQGDSQLVDAMLQCLRRSHGRGGEIDVLDGEGGLSSNATGLNAVTPLFRAVESSRADLVQQLLTAGAQPFALCKVEGLVSTPMHCAIENGADAYGILVIRMLDSFSNPNARKGLLNSVEDGQGHLALHKAVVWQLPAVARLLVDAGADWLQHTSLAGAHHQLRATSPLLLLVAAMQEGEGQRGSPQLQQMAREVLAHWAPLEHTARALHTDLHPDNCDVMAAWLRSNHKRTLQPFLRDRTQIQALMNTGNVVLLRLLTEFPEFVAGGTSPCSMLHLCDPPLMQALLDAGLNINTPAPATSGAKTFLLHTAVAMRSEGIPMVRFLLDHGAILDSRDADGNTALHLAINAKDKEIVEMLLQRPQAMRALKVQNDNGQTPEALLAKLKGKDFKDWLTAALEQKRCSAPAGEEDPETSTERGHRMTPEAFEEEMLDRKGQADAAEPLEVKQARMSYFLRLVPTALARAEAASAAAAAATADAVKAQVRASREATQASRLAALKPDYLPERDQPAVCTITEEDDEGRGDPAADGLLAGDVGDHDRLIEALQNLPWVYIITRDARQSWASMNWPFRRMVFKSLHRIAQGHWQADGNTARRLGHVRDLEVYRTKLTKGARIVFEVAVDYDQKSKSWREMLRLWVITLDHDKYEKELENIAESHKKSQKVRQKLELEAVKGSDVSTWSGQRLPKLFLALGGTDKGLAVEADAPAMPTPAEAKELREHFPPASAGQDTYTLLKFYNLSSELLRSVLDSMDDSVVDFPFRVSPAEQEIIELEPDPPAPMLLVGRSGTGKTTCAVFRMWARWHTFYQQSTEPFNQVFLTASATLRQQVAKAFRKLQANVLCDAEESLRLEELSRAEYHSLAGIPADAFPLFWTTKQFLRALDATLPQPFFPRKENGAMLHAEDDEGMSLDGADLLVDLNIDEWLREWDEQEEHGGMDDGRSVAPSMMTNAQAEAAQAALQASQQRRRVELSYAAFVDHIFRRLPIAKEDKGKIKASLLWQEIMSYIKGSAEAMDSPGGRLDLDGYLEVGRKRAPNFKGDTRRIVYRVYEQYEREKTRSQRYDNMDLVSHIYRALKAEGYRGTPIHNLYRDEVQDFAQAELLMDLRVCSDPNGLFYCGDTCQTIARGIGFRFTDICTLFHDEAQRRKEAGGEARARPIGVPKAPHHLKVNYRTHSGILDVAASVVDLLKIFFPQHMDNLDRERAFFEGPHPLLLSALSTEDITILLSGSDPKTSQVEFGAHQVILVRNTDAIDTLPEALQTHNSKALIMTVPQSKGLEFDDVFLVDFFKDSPASAEWRVLSGYLQELQEKNGVLPTGLPLQEVDVNESDEGHLRPLAFDARAHVLLSEELKHLYTAITRAKNNIVIFDSSPAKRAPFFHFLRRLGMARVVKGSLTTHGVDASMYGLSQSQSSSEEWCRRGVNLLENEHFGNAADAFTNADEHVWATMAAAQARLVAANSLTNLVHKKREFWLGGHDLVWAAAKADEAHRPVDLPTRRNWLTMAAKAIAYGGDVSLATQLFMDLGQHDMAVRWAQRLGGSVDTARVLAQAKRSQGEAALAEGDTAAALKLLGEACRLLRRAKDCRAAFALLQQHPQLASRAGMPDKERNEVASVAMVEAHAVGDHQTAIAASVFISDLEMRTSLLREKGYWEQLAAVTTDVREAAKILGMHGQLEAAVERLAKPLDDWRSGPCPLGPEAVKQLHNYCLKLRTPAALQKVWMLREMLPEYPYPAAAHMAHGEMLLSTAREEGKETPPAAFKSFESAHHIYKRSHNSCGRVAAFCGMMTCMADDSIVLHTRVKERAPRSKAEKIMGKYADEDAEQDTRPNHITWAIDEIGRVQVLLDALSGRSSHASSRKREEACASMQDFYGLRGTGGSRSLNSPSLTYSWYNSTFQRAQAAYSAFLEAGGTTGEWDAPKAVPEPSQKGDRLTVSMDLAAHVVIHDLLGKIQRPVIRLLNLALARVSNAQGPAGDLPPGLPIPTGSLEQEIQTLNEAARLHGEARSLCASAEPSSLVSSSQLRLLQETLSAVEGQMWKALLELLFPLAPKTGLLRDTWPKLGIGQETRMRADRSPVMQRVVRLGEWLLHTALSDARSAATGRTLTFSMWLVNVVAQRDLGSLHKAIEALDMRLSRYDKAGLLVWKGESVLDIKLLHEAAMHSLSGVPVLACQHILFFLERAWVKDTAAKNPTDPLPLQAYVSLLELCAAQALLGLGDTSFLPDNLVEVLEAHPLLHRAGGRQDARLQDSRNSVVGMKQYWRANQVAFPIVTQVVRLLYALCADLLGSPLDLSSRAHLLPQDSNAGGRSERGSAAGATAALKQTLAVRFALLGAAVVTALGVHSMEADQHKKQKLVPKGLELAAWQAVLAARKHLTDKDTESVQAHLQALGRKSKLIDRVQRLTQISAAAGFDGVREVSTLRVRAFSADIRKPASRKGHRGADRETPEQKKERQLYALLQKETQAMPTTEPAVPTSNTLEDDDLPDLVDSDCEGETPPSSRAQRSGAKPPANAQTAAKQALELLIESEVDEYDPTVDPTHRAEVQQGRLEGAAASVQRIWRTYHERAQAKAKIEGLKTLLVGKVRFLDLLRGSIARTRERLARQQQERRLAELRAQAGADARKRLSWAGAVQGMKLDNASCPFCLLPADTGTGEKGHEQIEMRNQFSVLEAAVNAPSFVPHGSRQEHRGALAAFQGYAEFYNDTLAHELEDQVLLLQELSLLQEGFTAGDAEESLKVLRLREALTKAGEGLEQTLAHIEKHRVWSEHTSLLAEPMSQHGKAMKEVQRFINRVQGLPAPTDPELQEAQAEQQRLEQQERQRQEAEDAAVAARLQEDMGQEPGPSAADAFDDWTVVETKKKSKRPSPNSKSGAGAGRAAKGQQPSRSRR